MQTFYHTHFLKPAFLILLSVLVYTSHAQDHWCVSHGKKTLLEATAEDTVNNKIVLKHEDLKKWGSVRIVYTENPERTDWQRTLFLAKGASEGLQTTGNRLKIRNRNLRKAATQNVPLYLYTASLPADPAVAAT